MNNNENQMANCESELKLIRQICETNNKLAEENKKETKEMLNNHCRRIRDTENDLTVIQTEVRPVISMYNKFSQFVIGFLIIVGGLFLGAIIFLKDILKK